MIQGLATRLPARNPRAQRSLRSSGKRTHGNPVATASPGSVGDRWGGRTRTGAGEDQRNATPKSQRGTEHPVGYRTRPYWGERAQYQRNHRTIITASPERTATMRRHNLQKPLATRLPRQEQPRLSDRSTPERHQGCGEALSAQASVRSDGWPTRRLPRIEEDLLRQQQQPIRRPAHSRQPRRKRVARSGRAVRPQRSLRPQTRLQEPWIRKDRLRTMTA